MAIIDYLRYEDLPADLQVLADVVGLDALKELIIKLGGISLYIPKTQSLTALQDRYVADNKHRPVKVLMEETGLSQRSVYRKLREKRE